MKIEDNDQKVKIQIRNNVRTRKLKFTKMINNIFEKCFKELRIVIILLLITQYQIKHLKISFQYKKIKKKTIKSKRIISWWKI